MFSLSKQPRGVCCRAVAWHSVLPLALLAAVLLGTGVARAEVGVRERSVLFGMHTALSGPAGPWGRAITEGVRMRFDEVNRAGGVHGRHLMVKVVDHGHEVPRAVQEVSGLIKQGGIFAMLGSLGTPHNLAVMPYLQVAGVPNLFPYSASGAMARPTHRLTFMALTPYGDQMRIATRYGINTLGAKRPCRITQSNRFGQETAEAVDAELAALGVPLQASTRHVISETDFTASVRELRAAGCDLLLLGTVFRDTILLNATVRAEGWQVLMIGNSASYDQLLAGQDAVIMEGYYAVTAFNMVYDGSDNDTDTAKAWRERFQEKYGHPASTAAQYGYIAADLAVTALDRVGRDLTREHFLTALETINGYRDPFGGPVMGFSATDHVGAKSAAIARVSEGRWAVVTPPLSVTVDP